jgi:hypothetical protein
MTMYQMFIWAILLVSEYLGHDFTEMAYVDIFVLIHIPR